MLSMTVKKFNGPGIDTDRLLEAYFSASKIPDLGAYTTDIIASQLDAAIEKLERTKTLT